MAKKKKKLMPKYVYWLYVDQTVHMIRPIKISEFIVYCVKKNSSACFNLFTSNR